jgi:hypothetical protein
MAQRSTGSFVAVLWLASTAGLAASGPLEVSTARAQAC